MQLALFGDNPGTLPVARPVHAKTHLMALLTRSQEAPVRGMARTERGASPCPAAACSNNPALSVFGDTNTSNGTQVIHRNLPVRSVLLTAKLPAISVVGG
jgi:hypothetical protein